MTEKLYCWRCDRVVPMMTEAEWQGLQPALARYDADIKNYRAEHGIGLAGALERGFEQPVLLAYRTLTGDEASGLHDIRHHRLSLLGPPCRRCGKPLRTPMAAMCVGCGLPARSAASSGSLPGERS